MLRVLTPNKEALSRSISIRASGLVKRKFTSAIWKTGLSFTFCINVGRNSCSLSKVGACNTYWIGIPPRRPPKVDCCCTKARAKVSLRTSFDKVSAISICERSRSLISLNMRFSEPPPSHERVMMDCFSGAMESAICSIRSA